ncbi:MAG: zinc-binding alcohol dehydrogenase family protein [Rhodoglobus sp.]
MKSMTVTAYGDADVIHAIERPEVPPGVGEVSITVSHAAVGLIDVLIRRGVFADHDGIQRPPFVPGLETAGTIRAIGEGVSDFRIGEPVATLTVLAHGGYAEVVTVPASLVISLEGHSIDPVQAVAALPNATTVHLALSRAIRFPSAARILVHGASGALASVVPAVARQLGASEIIGTVRSERLATARPGGFDRLVASESFAKELADLRFDVIVDAIGGAIREASIPLLAHMGRLLALGSAGSDHGAMLDSNQLWLANAGVVGFNVGLFFTQEPNAARDAALAVLPLLADKRLHLDTTTLPLAQAARAHQMLEDLPANGRVILSV